MSDRAIVSGVLFREPVEKTSKAGKRYLIATIRSGNSEAVRWWKAFCFIESVIEEMKRLGDGDPIAVAGEFDCSLYAPDGAEPRLSWTIRADSILSAKAKPKPKEAKPRADKPPRRAAPPHRTGPEIAASSWASPTRGGALDDEVPF